ncbi:hypothetical protein BCR44DRAFT_33911 [Catenaria anguillulae PL171]|uniref:Uncharacterized protein n=1 Tax=Catenaria anguillulae PL171 TaxID=765915 RepID=A0A1Y2HN84_9FUNG|nr:hypothetical protein BCR44DRAFT_33911 [Catenaria anguillulae PL171]
MFESVSHREPFVASQPSSAGNNSARSTKPGIAKSDECGEQQPPSVACGIDGKLPTVPVFTEHCSTLSDPAVHNDTPKTPQSSVSRVASFVPLVRSKSYLPLFALDSGIPGAVSHSLSLSVSAITRQSVAQAMSRGCVSTIREKDLLTKNGLAVATLHDVCPRLGEDMWGEMSDLVALGGRAEVLLVQRGAVLAILRRSVQ